MMREEQKRKILVIGPSPELARGGMSAVIRDIQTSRRLNEQFQIDIFSSYIDGNAGKRLICCAWAYLRFLALCRNYDLFHIHVAAYGSTFRKALYLKAAKRAGKRVILHMHGSEYLDFYGGLTEKGKKRVSRFLAEADLVLALSESWKEKFEKLCGIRNCRVLNNGIDTELLKEARTDPEKTRDGFLMLGRLGKRKGTYDLIKAAKRALRENPKIHIYLAGDGEEERVKRLVGEQGLADAVTVSGWIGTEEKLALLRRVSTVVLPSYNEGLPMFLLEGMAAGKAVVSTRVGAIPELIGEENGILTEPGDIDALSQALVRCSRDTGMLARMSEKNLCAARESFSIRRMHERLAGYYREAMKQTDEKR